MQFQWREGLTGLFVGAGIGVVAGFSLGTWSFELSLLYLVLAMLAGAVICGVAGFLFGESFLEWLKNYWWW